MKQSNPLETTAIANAAKGLLQPALLFCMVVLYSTFMHAQAVSGVITDYNGFWKSTAAMNNSSKPVNSHNLLSFTYNGVQYSTGVNDLLLAMHGESFVAGDFYSLPISNMSGAVTTNTRVSVGEMYDGVHDGASNPPPLNDISFYLNDGIKGLNIGTGIANLPAGSLSFSISSINPNRIGDGIPDILVTQIADPGAATDSYTFLTAGGAIVGHKKDITFTSILPVAKWTGDFYEASTNPMILTSTYTKSDRDLRLWAADLSDFGITAGNYQSISKFTINLSGISDVAFVAYNNASFTINVALPVTLSDFSAKKVNTVSKLAWTTKSQSNTAEFIIERSIDNNSFEAIGLVKTAGNSVSPTNYGFTDKHPVTGVNYYRLKITDTDGKFEYSKTISVQFANNSNIRASLFPNPCTNNVIVNHPVSSSGQVTVYNAAGTRILKMNTAESTSQTIINMEHLQPGIYYIVWQDSARKISMPVMKK